MINPIETTYKGYRFRSRLEARWAVFFDALGIRWEYEKEGYELSQEYAPLGIRKAYYLPDFWLPEQNCFIEIKGEYPTEEEFWVAEQLAKATGKDVLIFWGPIGEYPDDSAWIFSGGDGWQDNCYSWQQPEEQYGWGRKSRPTPKPKWDVVFAESNYINRNGDAEIARAYNIARSARFEHGENGGQR